MISHLILTLAFFYHTSASLLLRLTPTHSLLSNICFSITLKSSLVEIHEVYVKEARMKRCLPFVFHLINVGAGEAVRRELEI